MDEAETADWPPTTVAMLSLALNDMGLRSRNEELLRACQRRYPTSSGINQLLSDHLYREPDPDHQEVLRFASAGQATRTDNAVVTTVIRDLLRKLGRAVRRRVHDTFMAAAPRTFGRCAAAAWFLVGSSDPVVRDPALALDLVEEVQLLIEAGGADIDADIEDEDRAGLQRIRGFASYLLGRDREAVDAMEAALHLDPEADRDLDHGDLIIVALALDRLGDR